MLASSLTLLPAHHGVRGQSTPAPPSPPRYEVALEEVRIAMSDGVRLAADLWRPKDAAGERFPVLLEYLPYRKDESRGGRYDVYSYFVRRGYVVARVDIRGVTINSPHVNWGNDADRIRSSMLHAHQP